MTKQEYLFALEQQLRNYPQDFKEDILEAFEGHFQEGLDSGLSEEEVIDTLGSIDEVMENIQMMHGDIPVKEDDPTQSLKSNMEAISSNIKDLARNVSAVVNEGIQVALNKPYSFDVRTGDPVSALNDTISTDATTLSIRGNLDLEVYAGDTLSYSFGQYKNIFSKNLMNLETHEEGSTFTFAMYQGDGKLTLQVPPTIKNILVNGYSEDILIKGLTLETIDVVTTHGDIELIDIQANQARVSSENGDIKFENFDIASSTLKSLNGDIDLIRGKGSVISNCTSGDIQLKQVVGEVTTNTCDSGDIDIEGAFSTIQAASSAGDVSVYLSGPYKTLELGSQAGDIDLHLFDTNVKIEVTTDAGDIEVKNSIPCSPRRMNSYFVGNGENIGKIQTDVGDITIS